MEPESPLIDRRALRVGAIAVAVWILASLLLDAARGNVPGWRRRDYSVVATSGTTLRAADTDRRAVE